MANQFIQYANFQHAKAVIQIRKTLSKSVDLERVFSVNNTITYKLHFQVSFYPKTE